MGRGFESLRRYHYHFQAKGTCECARKCLLRCRSPSGNSIRDFLDDSSKPRENHHHLKARTPFVKTVGSSAAVMLRIYFMQQWHNLSDPASEDRLYD